MRLTEIKGLKFPDEYLVKFFFKEGLNSWVGDVVEFGCGNGNNLMLFNHFGWNTTGLDINIDKIGDAEHNFSKFAEKYNYSFKSCDISKGVKDILGGKFDVILFPGVLYYISRDSVLNLLEEVSNFIKTNSMVYLRMRSIKDYRYGRGNKIEHNGFILDIKETGEYQALNVFYYEYELVDMLREKLWLDVSTMHIFPIDFINLHNGIPVLNSDIVIWGKCDVG